MRGRMAAVITAVMAAKTEAVTMAGVAAVPTFLRLLMQAPMRPALKGSSACGGGRKTGLGVQGSERKQVCGQDRRCQDDLQTAVVMCSWEV